jgi:hypothetical protein
MLENVLFSEAVKIQLLNTEDAITVAKLPVSTAFIDVSEYHQFAFLIAAGALNSALTFQVQQDTSATQTAAIKNITGAAVTVAATGDDKWYLVEVQSDHLDINNDFRYVTLDMSGAAAADDFGAVFFLGFAAGKMPVTQGADKGAIVTLAG